ncbi:MAG: AGE family epimerase/isomerase [Acidobacteriota bacterium]|nr:AGE family epimerase/isomerase [Acidobacteriota bacterium]
MRRRQFIGSISALAGAAGLPACGRTERAAAPASREPKRPGGDATLAGKPLAELRRDFERDLEEYVDFFIRHGIDFKNGGFMCGLDHDGALVNANKYLWFQGRGVWVFSHLYSWWKKEPRFLGIAQKTCDFMLKHFPQDPEGFRWATWVAVDGTVITPYENDPFGCYFGIEGMFELAEATGDAKLREKALDLYIRHYRFVRDPGTRLGKYPPGTRGFNMEMADLQIATQFLRRRDDERVRKIAAECVDVIMNRYYNPEIKMFYEILGPDLRVPKGWENQSNPGHNIEIMWMVMAEARRAGDRALFNLAKERALESLEIGWDEIYGGVVAGVRVGEGCFEWPVLRVAGTSLEFRERGEYSYTKSHWSIGETLIATITAFEDAGEEWADRYFTKAKTVNEEKFSLRPHGYPLHLLFSDRKIAFTPHATRKDNYHYMRACILCMEAIDRMIGSAKPEREIRG